MVIELKRGYTIESFYDKFTRSYITRLLDPERNQIRDALYSGDITGRNYDIQDIKDFFVTYMKDPNFNTEPVENFEEEDSIQEKPVDEEQLEESLITESVGNLYVYHATDNRNIDSINKSGLLINSGTGNWEKMYCEGKVFLALSAEVAIDYVEAQDDAPEDIVLLKIPADIFEYQYVGYDWNNRCEYHEDINSFTYSKNIPIEYLQVCDPAKEPSQDIDDFKGTDIGEKILEVFYEECETNMEEFDEALDLELEKKARKTRRATKKSKLPALSKLSPIIPDPAKGIAAFNGMTADGNSGMASTTGSTCISEAYMSRNELIKALQKMGFKYKFDKYSDKQLYRIYQERTKAMEKKAIEKKKQEYEDAYQDQKRKNASDSYFKDGIEFESEEAAKDYFGESMKSTIYLSDMHEAWDIVEDEVSKPLNEGLEKDGHGFKTLNEGLQYFERQAFDESCQDIGLEPLFESMRDRLSSDDIKKLGAFMNHAQNSDEVITYMKGLLSDDKEGQSKIKTEAYDYETDQDALRMIAYPLANEVERAVSDAGVWAEDNGCNIYPEDNAVELVFYVDGDWKFDHKRFDIVARKAIENLGYKIINEYEDDVEDSESDSYGSNHIIRVDVSTARTPVDESLNEAYIEDAWIEMNPEDEEALADCGITIEELGSAGVLGTKYRFSGSKEAIEKAKAAGYFYDPDLKVEEDESEKMSEDEVNNKFVEALSEAGFILDHSVRSPISKGLFGSTHFQVINPDLQYPTSESEGEEISEDDARRFFIDDLKEAVGVIEMFENEYGLDITYNFGPNRDNVVTAGIDIHRF